MKTVYDFVVKDRQGKEVSLSDYRGKVVILNFWGTTCAPCVEELPYFEQLKTTYPDVEILAIHEVRGIGVTWHEEDKPLWRAVRHREFLSAKAERQNLLRIQCIFCESPPLQHNALHRLLRLYGHAHRG